MTAVAAIYALVISVMLGKAVSDFITERSLLHAIILLGSLMFFVSDIALAFNVFGGSPAWSNTLCLFTYFPGQCVIALSLYFYNVLQTHLVASLQLFHSHNYNMDKATNFHLY